MQADEPGYLIALCTCPDAETAARLAGALVEQGLAACVNIVAGVTSVYRWQGRVHHDSEQLLIIKTRRARYQKMESRLRELHPYELPEIVAVPMERGLEAYLEWIRTQTDGGTQA
jgi:periplasmic divalent cation tolerance protein